jgi:hypothetical protein
MSVIAMASSSGSLSTNNDNGKEFSDECSIDIDSLMEDHQTYIEHNAQSRSHILCPISDDDRQESSPTFVSEQAGSSQSKLDLLRARNQHARRRGSMKIMETRKSLNASSSSLLPSPEPATYSKHWDESTVETVSSRTWTESPPPSSTKKLERPIPVQVLLQHTNASTRRSKTLESVPSASIFEFVEQSRLLQEENELLRRHISLLHQLHDSSIQNDRVKFRDERRCRARTRMNRLWVTLIVLVTAFMGHFVLNLDGIDGVAVSVDSRFVASTLNRLNVLVGHKQALADECEEKALLNISTFGFPGTAMHELEYQADDIIEPRLEDMNAEQRRSGPLKRFLINIKHDNLGSWLKVIKS